MCGVVNESRGQTNLAPCLINHQLWPDYNAAVIIELGYNENENNEDGHDSDDTTRGGANARVLDGLGKCVETGEP